MVMRMCWFRNASSCILGFLLIFGPFLTEAAPQERETHEVSVEAMAAPLFAVDSKGNPVKDIRKEELTLLVNDKPAEIAAFRYIDFGPDSEEGKPEPVRDELPVKEARETRVIFIILDTMFNGLTGFRRSQEIAINLIRNGYPRDQFILLENNPFGGLKYLGGPVKEKKELLDVLSAMKPPADKWYEGLHRSRDISNNLFFDPSKDPRQFGQRFMSLAENDEASDRQQYQHNVKRFIEVLSQFRYALKTIDKPKIVFLISEGVAIDAFRAEYGKGPEYHSAPETNDGSEPGRGFYSAFAASAENKTVMDSKKLYSGFMLNYLVKVVQSINSGGAVLYAVSPKEMDDTMDEAAGGESALRFLAGESGGKFFKGSEPKKIVQEIKKATSAYYEIYFNVLPEMGKNMAISVKCSRPGVHIHSLLHSERNKPYRAMELIQKKVFAVNVATGGTWSRLVAQVKPAKFKTFLENGVVTARIPLPEEMRNRKLDIFLIRMHPKTYETKVDYVGGAAKTQVDLKFREQKEMNRYFVVVEPDRPYCLFNQVKD